MAFQPPPQQHHPHLFPPALNLYYNSGGIPEISDDEIKFTLGPSVSQPLYTAALETDLLGRPKLTLVPAAATGRNENATPLAVVKSKGLKDAIITLPPLPGSGYPQATKKLSTHYGFGSRTYSFNAPVGNSSERFVWRKGTGGNLWSLKERRELIRTDGGCEVVATWSEGSGLSLTKTGSFRFVGSGATGVFGPQWEIMVVVSVLRIWHEDYHATKTIADVLGGGGD
jgi:hypothetical protein